MKRTAIIAAAVLATVASLGVQPASAQLLGGILGGDGGGVLGGTDSVVTVSSGSASNEGLANVGLGGGDGGILDVNLGGSSTTGHLANVNVGSGGGGGGSGGLLDADVGLLGSGSLAGLDIGLGGNGLIDLDIGGPGGTDGTNGGNGTSGFLTGGGGGAAGAAAGAACVGADGRQVLQIAARQRATASTFTSWRRASNVQIVPIRLCPNVRRQVAAALDGSSKVNMVRSAVASDALISTSLSRTRYGSGDVFAVQRAGSQLTVYVY